MMYNTIIMEGLHQDNERDRILPLNTAWQVFGIQLEMFPELMAEIVRLAGGRAGVLHAVLESSADAISYDPMPETTPERIRGFVGAPEQDSELNAWREGFWEKIVAESARNQ